jgi:hypothetical protein
MLPAKPGGSGGETMKGEITISHYTNLDEIHIKVVDSLSTTRFIDVKIKPSDLMLALTGLGNVNCQFDLMAEHVGQVIEHKEEVVRLRQRITNTPAEEQAVIEKALRPFRVDGWFAREGDLGNSHLSVKYGKTFVDYRVTFYRYVNPPRR